MKHSREFLALVSVIPFLDSLIFLESQVVIRPWCLSWRGAWILFKATSLASSISNFRPSFPYLFEFLFLSSCSCSVTFSYNQLYS